MYVNSVCQLESYCLTADNKLLRAEIEKICLRFTCASASKVTPVANNIILLSQNGSFYSQKQFIHAYFDASSHAIVRENKTKVENDPGLATMSFMWSALFLLKGRSHCLLERVCKDAIFSNINKWISNITKWIININKWISNITNSKIFSNITNWISNITKWISNITNWIINITNWISNITNSFSNITNSFSDITNSRN